jgi:hypothetical protein
LDPKDVDPIEQAVADAIDVDKVPSDATTEISDTEAEPEAAEESCEAELSNKGVAGLRRNTAGRFFRNRLVTMDYLGYVISHITISGNIR